jgi:hypothetical protein
MSQASVRRGGGREVRRKKSNSNRTLIIGAAVIVLVILVAVGLSFSRNIGVVAPEHVADMGIANPHIQNPTDPHPPYNSNPPTSGYHWGGGTAPWGVQTQPIADEFTVHNLEHGGVIIHYRQNLDKATVDQLTTLARELQQSNPCIILVPRPVDKLDVPIAVTSWTYLLKLQTFDANSIRAFYKSHVGYDGPEKICRAGA